MRMASTSENDNKRGDFGALNIMYSEMTESDQSFTVDTCFSALRNQEKKEMVSYYKDTAESIKVELENKKEGKWNVVVGKSFGAFVTHETKTMVYFYIGSVGFLCWRHG